MGNSKRLTKAKIVDRHPTGFPKSVGRFDARNVSREGPWVFFNTYGRAEEIGQYLKNKRHGPWQIYDWKNASAYEVEYVHGKAGRQKFVGKITPQVAASLPDAFFEFRVLVR